MSPEDEIKLKILELVYDKGKKMEKIKSEVMSLQSIFLVHNHEQPKDTQSKE